MPRAKHPSPISGRKFDGILRVPIAPKNLLLELAAKLSKYGSDSNLTQFHAEERNRQIEERINALKIHYRLAAKQVGIELGYKPPQREVSDRELLLVLAADFIPGFRDTNNAIEIKVGRKKGSKKTSSNGYELAEAVCMKYDLMPARKTVLGACRLLTKDRKSKWHNFSLQAVKSAFCRDTGTHQAKLLNDKDFRRKILEFMKEREKKFINEAPNFQTVL
jgi:hypothetical protein